MLEKTLKSPLDCKEIKPVNPKGDQPGIFIGRTDAEAPILWPPDVKSWLGKDHDAGKDWGQEEEGMTEDEIVGWHHWLNGHEVEQTPGKWWRTGEPGMLQSMGSQRVRHDWATELNWNLSDPCTHLSHSMEQNLSSLSCASEALFVKVNIPPFPLGESETHSLTSWVCICMHRQTQIDTDTDTHTHVHNPLCKSYHHLQSLAPFYILLWFGYGLTGSLIPLLNICIFVWHFPLEFHIYY